MDVVDISEGHYAPDGTFTPRSVDSDDASSSESDIQDSEDYEVGDLKEDLQKTVPECYRSESNLPSNESSDINNDEEFQASALCKFMDILNDLDEVLDKSLLACLDESTRVLDSDENDVVCKVRTENNSNHNQPSSSNDVDVISVVTAHSSQESPVPQTIPERPKIVRSKSFSDLLASQVVSASIEREPISDDVRGSMRRLDPIVLPAITAEQPLTLPVILFLEHNVNMRPTSAPIQLQVTAANLSGDVSSGPLIVGRRTLLMNRALSLPSPGDSDVIADWAGRSVTRSTSTSSSSTESLNGVLPSTNTLPSALEDRNDETEEPPFGVWPHGMSCLLACLSCTVGIFNISRFAIFSIHFGASFIVQFFILSLLIGIPLFTLHLCLGRVLEAGPVDMWRISPIFQGVGISLLLTQAVMGLYSIIGVSWIFVYFRDSFITADDKYKWALPHSSGYEESENLNGTFKIQETLPQYFHGEVLQRNLASYNTHFGTIKFQVAFNLAVVWMVVFVSLSKGLRSYGKAVYVLIFLPICGTIVLCTKLLTLIPYDSVTNIFSETEWSEFFINSNSWASAAQEVFLTWGLLGACIMQLTSHKTAKNKVNSLQKESACIVAFTFAILLLAAFLANTCLEILKKHGFVYVPGSFENVKSSQFLWPSSSPLPASAAATPVRYMTHYASLVGVSAWRGHGAAAGWQPLQFATQIVPATLAVLPEDLLSPAWAIIFYFILIMFGIAQQLAIWHCVIAGIMAINAEALRVWETTITFLSCLVGLMVGLVLSTDAGIRIVHFLDYVVVGSWWQVLTQAALVCGVFVVRGRPYSGEAVVAPLFRTAPAAAAVAALLSFTWNVILPVVLCTLCVIDFRTGQQRVLYNWRKPAGYWPIWAREIAVAMQQGALLIIPVTAFIQTWRYISKGPPDILDRIQNLYRPRLEPDSAPPQLPPAAPAPSPRPPDPPPKYTPPPSYSTATGARIMNTLRRSFRTLRRITTTRPESQLHDTSQIPITLSETVDSERHIPETSPPEYSGVFPPTLTVTDEVVHRLNRPVSSTSRSSLTLTRDFLRRSFVRKSDSVKSIRCSLRRSFKFGGLTASHEQLVRGAEPISSTVAMTAVSPPAPAFAPSSRASLI